MDNDAQVDLFVEEWIGYWDAAIPNVPIIGNGPF